jgi:hypothetical protein
MPRTIYHATDGRGNGQTITDTERAARLSRAGLTVTATTLGADE